ncbi:2-hydroxyacid dehydrogenase [Bacillus kwashiorkori]|uniref:2-hydroxyacid dehydrogenase n=1 Tax=Bacillus kwashiorkori TaxID=1522318 RepID=UPI000780BFB5|nr:D-glycerate dehydrogenase [Bacillus kwashiorkori]
MRKPYVYITRKLPEPIVDQFRLFSEVKMWNSENLPVPREVLLEEASKADALLTMLSDKVDQQLLSVGKNLKVIANLAVGFDNIDVIEATKRGVAVCNTPDILTDTTADLVFSLILMTARKLVEAVDCVKSGEWKSWSPLFMAGADVHHKTIGIVGMGKIGEAVAKRALGFDMKVLYHNRNRKVEAEQTLGVTYQSFNDLVSESDFVVCLTPLTEETKGMFNKETFRKMKHAAFFINASRGAVAVEKDLVDALKNGEIAGAGLDVFVKEPIDLDHPLLQLENVVALPHIGSASVETRLAMMKRCCQNIELILNGKQPLNVLNM